MRFQGRSAVVTGAGRGIGRATAQRLAREGANVFALDRSPEPQDPLDGVRFVHCDCSEEGSVARAIASVEGPIHVLVNNAGVNPSPASLTETAPAEWDAVMETNVRGTYLVSRAVIPRMTEGGAIVHVASILGLTAVRSASAYTASKAAIVGLTRAMARDHAPSVRVNCVCPGAIDTDMFRRYVERVDDPDAEAARIVAEIPLGRLGAPEDVADAVAFLASDDAAWITGSVLVVDGGDSA